MRRQRARSDTLSAANHGGGISDAERRLIPGPSTAPEEPPSIARVSQDHLTVGDEERPAVEADRERAYGIGRLMAFSDGVVAIAITLLVLNVPVPDIAHADATSRLPAALLATGPHLLTFALSFFLVGFYWIRHHQLFSQLVAVDVWLLWLILVLLFLVCLLPFSSGVVGRYFDTVVAAEVYAVNLAGIALSFTALNLYATRGRLVRRVPGTMAELFSRGFLWPLVVVGLVMALAPINLTVAYVIGATLMAAVSVYTALPQVVRSAPLASTGRGQLQFGTAAARVNVHADGSMPELFRARFTGPEPAVIVAGNVVDVEYGGVRWRKWRRQSADIVLNNSIPWRLEARAGVATLTADLRGVRVSELSITGGVGRLDLRLPRPSGRVPIHIRDGAVSVSIRRPNGAAVQATFPDGAASVELDERRIGPILGQTPVQSPDYEGATDRYDVEVQGGAAELTIATER